MTKVSEIADSIKRHMSGQTDGASVAKDAIQDGFGKSDHSQNGELDNDNKKCESAVSKQDDNYCASCNKEWETPRSKGTPIESRYRNGNALPRSECVTMIQDGDDNNR